MQLKTIIFPNGIEHLIIRKSKMNAQQLYDCIIKPTHLYMGGNYESKNANFLSLCTAAIESNCGYYIKQVGGPALGVWQMEPVTHDDIFANCDAMQDCDNDMSHFKYKALQLSTTYNMDEDFEAVQSDLIDSPKYACAMARLKYSMDKAPLPDHNDIKAVYDYYKRIYNTPLGASTYEKFQSALANNQIMDVEL